jgi:hypothetical protein
MQRISSLTTAGTLLFALALPAGAQAATDRNHDRIPDRWERAHHLSLRVNQARRDQDHDGLYNRTEYLDHTNPRRKDSDRDGILDGDEDADHDGVANEAEEHDGAAQHREPISTVASFADGQLDVRQPDATDVVAAIDDATRLLCAPPVEHSTAVACSTERLVPGTRVLVARRTNDHWDMVILRAAAGGGRPANDEDDPADTGDDAEQTTTPPLAPPVPPARAAAPASTGVVTTVGDGSITITRPSGEVVPGVVRASTVLRCIRVWSGYVVSDEPCSTSHLVVGRQVALAQRTQIDGGWTWSAIALIEPAR